MFNPINKSRACQVSGRYKKLAEIPALAHNEKFRIDNIVHFSYLIGYRLRPIVALICRAAAE
jgi:hypothetical protein